MRLILLIIVIIIVFAGIATGLIYWYIIKKDLLTPPTETYDVQKYIPNEETIIF